MNLDPHQQLISLLQSMETKLEKQKKKETEILYISIFMAEK